MSLNSPRPFRLDGQTIQSLVDGASSRLDLWTQIAQRSHARTVVEIGVWKGEFAAHLLTTCQQIETYYMIDPWARLSDWNKPFNVSQERFDDIHREAMERVAFAADKVVVLRGRTKDVVDHIPDGALDLAYVDGDHTLRGITVDLIRLLPKMAPDGLLGGDDFWPNPWQHDARFEPTLVCPFAAYFAEAHDLPITVLPWGQFLIRNGAGASFELSDATGLYGDLSLNKPRPGLLRRLLRAARRRFSCG